MDTQFIGEHLWPGRLGHFFAITSFVAALFSVFSYAKAASSEKTDLNGSRSWLAIGRGSFVLHAVTVLGIFFALYYIIANHLFEYNYAWQHSSKALPMQYLLSCFWEGQEGSFMLWSFWHCVLGMVVMKSAGLLESRVMTVIGVVQVMLASMLLGFYITPDIKIGSTPFMLLRDQMADAPIFSQANYLSFIEDGNGLNPLLQNYWMVIHPPILFLGFAATLVPFAYTIAALWQGDYKQWVKPALNWSLFAGAALGTGIMMGGAWAYESLTFGGYWAWDPVENASLVPWLTLIAGLHTLVVYKATGRSFVITVFLLVISYLLIWYSTFLTRTGVLGDTSVHAFTGEGQSLYWHLLIVMGLLLIGSLVMIFRRWRSLPVVTTEEQVASREFWMFIGSFILFLSATQIIISTSIPVWSPLAKWLTGKEIAPPVDPVTHYNSIQLWVAIILALLSAAVLYLRFKTSDKKQFWKRIGITGGIALAISLLIGFTQKIDAPQYALLLFASSFSVVASIYYIISVQKGKLKKAGPAIAHLGFGLSLLGILLSSYNKQVISFNTLGVLLDFGKETQAENAKESRENVLLFRNTPVAMGDYMVTYKGDSTSETDPRTFYIVHYERYDESGKNVVESFTLYPDAFVNPKGQTGLIANPDSKHYLHKDVFTYVTSVVDPTKKTDTSTYTSYKMKVGDTAFLNTNYLIFHGFDTNVDDPNYEAVQGDVAVAANLGVYSLKGDNRELAPIYYIRNGYEHFIEDTLESGAIFARLAKILPDENAATIMLKQNRPQDDYIVMKALVFPFINVLWLGIIVMVAGFIISMVNRMTKKEKEVKTGR